MYYNLLGELFDRFLKDLQKKFHAMPIQEHIMWWLLIAVMMVTIVGILNRW